MLNVDQVHMEDVNHFAGSFVEELAKQVVLSSDQQDRLFESIVASLEAFFNYPDYRSL